MVASSEVNTKVTIVNMIITAGDTNGTWSKVNIPVTNCEQLLTTLTTINQTSFKDKHKNLRRRGQVLISTALTINLRDGERGMNP